MSCLLYPPLRQERLGSRHGEPRCLGGCWEQLKSRGETGWVFLLALQMEEFPVDGEAGETGDAP